MTKLCELATTHPQQECGREPGHLRHHLSRPGDIPARRCEAARSRGDSIARLFNIPLPRRSRTSSTFDIANAIKFTLYRTRPNGSPGDWDVLGCQQYGPLMDLEIP